MSTTGELDTAAASQAAAADAAQAVPPHDLPPTDLPPTDLPPADLLPTHLPPTDLPPWVSALPGPELAAVLAGFDVAAMRSDFDVLEVVAAWERVIAWAQAQQLAAVAEFARRPNVLSPDEHAGWARRGRIGAVDREWADDEIAARLNISRLAADTRISVGAALAGPLQATGQALAQGRIDFVKAKLMSEACGPLAVDVARDVEARVLPKAEGQTPSRLRQALAKAVLAADPQAAQERHERARDERRVVLTPVPDGMAELWALLPAPDAIAIYTAITAAATTLKGERGTGDERGMDQLRADALAAPFNHALATGVLDGVHPTTLAKPRGVRAALQVTVPASVLLGISTVPGELAGYGPITPEMAREIATDATWRRLLTDPVDGTLLDVDPHVYRPPARLDRYIRMRDRTCRTPTCAMPASRCELDHTLRHPDGPTSANNLGPLCTRHHHFKHEDRTGERLRQIAPGVFRWIMPTGHTYVVRAEPIAPPLDEELGRKPPHRRKPPPN